MAGSIADYLMKQSTTSLIRMLRYFTSPKGMEEYDYLIPAVVKILNKRGAEIPKDITIPTDLNIPLEFQILANIPD